uniref:DUF3452 domain-containing protein n=1 Tax=Caenorhabditis tropicalis TaxID=1561998 RepID=A0A1I7TCK8_9PELO
MNCLATEQELLKLAMKYEIAFQNELESRRGLRETDDQFLDHINRVIPITDVNVIEFLHLATRFLTPISRRRVERFLIADSKKSTIDKWKIAKEYKLENLKVKCHEEAQMAEDQNAALLVRLKETGQFPGVERKGISEKDQRIK